jgi:hypothetical protein
MTDLIILPNASNRIVNTLTSAAKGVLYFDDGISYAKNVSKTELSYTYIGTTDDGANSTNV